MRETFMFKNQNFILNSSLEIKLPPMCSKHTEGICDYKVDMLLKIYKVINNNVLKIVQHNRQKNIQLLMILIFLTKYLGRLHLKEISIKLFFYKPKML